MDPVTRYLLGAVDAWCAGDPDLALELLNEAAAAASAAP